MTIGRVAMGMSLFALSTMALAQDKAADDPLLHPIEPDYAKRWLAPQPPVHLFGNSYYVGFGGLSVGLVRTSAGLILIDGALPQAVRDIEANIRTLGFDIRDVKFILSTEPHYDHAGGIAALARDSGATVVASAAAARTLRAGGRDPTDAQAPLLATFPAPAKIRVIGDREALRLGDVTVTAVAMPGHTPGSMSWTWRSCEDSVCVPVVFAASLNPVSADGYRFSSPANRAKVTAFRTSFTRMRKLPCGILITSHPDMVGSDTKRVLMSRQHLPSRAVDATACRKYADHFATVLDTRLAKEISAQK